MKLYSVKPEYLYGDNCDAKRQVQLDLLNRLGITESENLGVAICNGDQAIELFNEGYCGTYMSVKESIKPLYEVKSELNIGEIIESSVRSSADAVARLFNDKCQQEQPGPNLMSVDETMLKEDCCTDELQEALSNGWRILAVCPQPQRRPDYVLGRKLLPKSAQRG
jgi:hypothetical protein